jgi:hypothetical protein
MAYKTSSLIGVLFLVAACAGTQDPNSLLLSDKVSSLPGPLIANYHGELMIGPSKDVPIRIDWSTAKDELGCLRIVDLKVQRTGGNPSLVINGVHHSAIKECAMEWESKDETRFQTVVVDVNYKTRVGIKTHSFSGGIVSLQGNGKFKPI